MQTFNRLAWRGSLWGCFVLLLVLTFYVSAGRILTPMLNAYRVEIQDWLGGHLGQPLHLGRLHAGWHGLSPRFYAEDVRLGEADRPLHIERLHFRPDMLASLLRRSWSLAAISLQGLEIELRQQEDRWLVNGIELGGSGDGQPVDWQAVLEHTGRVQSFSLVEARVLVYPQDAAPFELPDSGLTLEQSGSDRQLQSRIMLPDGQLLELAMKARVQPEYWRQGSLEAYLHIPASNWLQWLPPAWLQWLPDDLQLDEAALQLQAWLQMEQGRVSRVLVDSSGGRLLGQAPSGELDIGLGRVRAMFSDDGKQRQLWLPQLNVRWLPQAGMHNLSLQLRQDAMQPVTEAATDIAIASLQLEPLMAAVLQHVPMPPLAHDILTQLDFRGQLRNTRLRWTPGLPWQQQLEYDTNLAGLDYSPWESVPGATGIHGRLFGSLAGGELHLDSDGFSLFLRELFADAWQYHRANAHLTWALAENLDFTLTSPYLQVQGDEGRLAGDFVIHLPSSGERESYMDLRVGMRDGDASYKARYLPLVLRNNQQQLWQWLHEAIQDGEVHQGYFQYQGSLRARAPAAARSISLYFDVSNARLAYQPGWPLLEEGRARVFVHDNGVEIEIDRAKILQTLVTDARAGVMYPGSGPSVLQVAAQLDSSIADALHVVQQTPLADELEVMSDWQGKGSLSGALQLDIPFAAGQPAHVQLNLQLDDNELYMPTFDIRLDRLQGNLGIDSRQGLSGNAVSGRFLEQPFTASLQPQEGSSGWSSQIRARGGMPVARLQQWLGYEQPLPLDGAFDYQLDLALGRDTQLSISTDLQGVAIDLPVPLAKPAQQAIPTRWHMTFAGREQQYHLVHGTRLNALFAAAGNRLRGQLMLGGRAAQLPAGEGLWVNGQLDRLHVPDWLAALERYSPPVTGSGEGALQEVQLQIGHLEGYGLPIEQAGLSVRPDTGNGWRIRLDSRQASGMIRVPAQGPLRVDMERLQIPADMAGLAGGGSGQLDPSAIPAMQVNIRQLLLGEEILGDLGFASHPFEGGVRFSELAANLNGLHVAGEIDWRSRPELHSSFQGNLSGENLEDVLRAWGYTAAINSERFEVGLELEWPGAPQNFSLAGLDGAASLKIRKGQLVALDGSAQALRVFGLLNFDSIGRRLRLDFKDLWGKGLSFDRIDGRMEIRQGVFHTREALTLEGISSNLRMTGSLDVPAGSINADLEVAMPISRNLPLAAVAVGAPTVGGALFVIDRLVGDRFARMAAVNYRITGDWHEPEIVLSRGGGDS